MEYLTPDIKYELLNYQVYRKRLNDLFNNKSLLSIGLSYTSIGKTTFGYDIDCIKVGKGEKELFLVGGTHGSEIISVDFTTQLLDEIKNIPNFDPNLFTLYVIPLQNPEGFEVTTNTLSSIKDTFSSSSREYYLKYRMDNILSSVIHELNIFINDNTNLPSHIFIKKIKNFINHNKVFNTLKDKRSIPEITILIKEINNIKDDLTYHELARELLVICSTIISNLNKKENITINDKFFLELLYILKEYFSNSNLWENIINDHLKLHQDMFKTTDLSTISNIDLQTSINNMYQEYNHPAGSQVTFDATGVGINLNANTLLNPGIEERKNNTITHLRGARENIINHVPGPLGSSTLDPYNFTYARENIALYNLINNSIQQGKYVATILYHGTGGLIYYLPSQIVAEDRYASILESNTHLAECYEQETGYKLMSESKIMGYGDYLRGTFPNVLMIELSKMGGNPIAPYGDKENILNCFQDNYNALNSVFSYFKKEFIEQNNINKK